MLVFLQIDPTKSVGSLSGRSAPGEPPTFKIEKKRQNTQEEKFPRNTVLDVIDHMISLLGDR